MDYLFYLMQTKAFPASEVRLDSKFKMVHWKPSPWTLVPRSLPWVPFVAWWVMHQLHCFSNREYSVLVVYDREMPVHHTVLFPGYFRFPFMNADDVQIGDVWTHSAYRNQGLASFAIQTILERIQQENRRLWFVVEENNKPSRSLVEKAGFSYLGRGIRTRRLGLSVLGVFSLEPESQCAFKLGGTNG